MEERAAANLTRSDSRSWRFLAFTSLNPPSRGWKRGAKGVKQGRNGLSRGIKVCYKQDEAVGSRGNCRKGLPWDFI